MFKYLKNYCDKNTDFKMILIQKLEEDRQQLLALARGSDDNEAEMYYDEADQIENIINELK